MRLGQHFLKNKEQIRKIINALDLRSGGVVVELGAGHGELTARLARLPIKQIIAVEKDGRLARFLKLKIKSLKLKVIEGDFLKELPRLTYHLPPNSYKLIGNIPYYLTGYLFRTIGELENKPSLIVFTIQKEVAERLIARPPKMNLLAASVQYWAEAEIIGRIPAEDFQPPPQVDSAIIKLSPKILSFSRLAGESMAGEEKKYYKFIRILFKQPRKTVLNNLRNLTDKRELEKILKDLKIKETARPQNLNLKMIESLLRTIYKTD